MLVAKVGGVKGTVSQEVAVYTSDDMSAVQEEPEQSRKEPWRRHGRRDYSPTVYTTSRQRKAPEQSLKEQCGGTVVMTILQSPCRTIGNGTPHNVHFAGHAKFPQHCKGCICRLAAIRRNMLIVNDPLK